LIAYVTRRLHLPVAAWIRYVSRDETRRQYAAELQMDFGYRPFTRAEYRRLRRSLTELALQTNKGQLLAQHLIELLRQAKLISCNHAGD